MSNVFFDGISLIIFIVMLGVLVFVHEFGHFIVAKRLNIPVLEFGFGFPPRLKVLGKRDETEYTLNAIPVGGFVRLMGEEDPNVAGGFASAKPAVRSAVLLAGVTMNLILAFIVFSLTAAVVPPYATVQTTSISAVASNSPAASAGLAKGDTIVAVNGKNVQNDYPALSQVLRANAGHPVTLTVVRSGRTLDPIQVTPRVNPPAGQGPLGIALDGWLGLTVSSVAPGSVADRAGVRAGDVLVFIVDPQTERALKDQSELAQFTTSHPGWKIDWRLWRDNKLLGPITVQIPQTVDAQNAALGLDLQTSPIDAPRVALGDMWTVVASVPTMVGQLVRGSAPPNSVVGVIGMAQATNELAQRGGAIALLQFLGLLSLNLAVVNLLPFPGLDGGHLIFVLLEWARGGKKIDAQKEGMVHLVGLAVLLGLMVIISFSDLQRLFSGQSIFP